MRRASANAGMSRRPISALHRRASALAWRPRRLSLSNAVENLFASGVNASWRDRYFTSRIVIAGLVAKKLCGISVKPNQWVGITGQSSIRGMW